MAKNENVFKRKEGRREARCIKGYEPSGKIRYGFCRNKTYREIKEKAAEYKASSAAGNVIPVNSKKHRFSFYCDEWLKQKRDRIRESTYIKYRTAIEKHIKPKLGGCFPSGIDSGAIEEFTHALLFEDKMAVKTVHDILTVLRGILKYTSAQLTEDLPEIVYPRERRREMRVLSRDEQKCFVDYLSEDMDACRFGLLLALFTGIRIGELCALQWKNINIRERTVHIVSTMQRLQDTDKAGERRTRIVIGAPKSDTSVRTIPMTGCAAALCEKMDCENSEAYILTGTEAYMEPRTLQYRVEKYARACGLEGVHAHTLRHTFATRAIEVGFEIKSLSEILGHSTTTVTMERYVHSSMELKRTNMNKLSAVGL